MILLVVFSIELKIFPVQGGTSIEGLVLPALTLAIPLAGFLGQVTRDEFEKVLDQPFVTSARARGMGDLAVRFKHVLRHAVLPAITLSGWALGALISGAVIVETVFARPGIGQMIVGAAEHRDVPLVSRRRDAGRLHLRGREHPGGHRLRDRRSEVARMSATPDISRPGAPGGAPASARFGLAVPDWVRGFRPASPWPASSSPSSWWR